MPSLQLPLSPSFRVPSLVFPFLGMPSSRPCLFVPSLAVPQFYFPTSYRAHGNLLIPSGVSSSLACALSFLGTLCQSVLSVFHALKLNPHQPTKQALLSHLTQEEIMQRSFIIYQPRAYSNPGLTDPNIHPTTLLLTICTESSAVSPTHLPSTPWWTLYHYPFCQQDLPGSPWKASCE